MDCVCVCVCVCTHTHTHTHTSRYTTLVHMQHLVPVIISEELTDLVPGMQYELYQNTGNRELGSPVIHTIHSYTENTVQP